MSYLAENPAQLPARREHRLVRVEPRPDWGGVELWFDDGYGVRVQNRDWEPLLRRSCGDRVVYVPGSTVQLEFSKGRWVPVHFEELPK